MRHGADHCPFVVDTIVHLDSNPQIWKIETIYRSLHLFFETTYSSIGSNPHTWISETKTETMHIICYTIGRSIGLEPKDLKKWNMVSNLFIDAIGAEPKASHSRFRKSRSENFRSRIRETFSLAFTIRKICSSTVLDKHEKADGVTKFVLRIAFLLPRSLLSSTIPARRNGARE